MIYEACAKQAYISYVEKRKQPEPFIPPGQTEAANVRGDRIHKALEAYVKGETDEIPQLKKPPTKLKIELNQYREWYAAGKATVEEEWGFDVDWQRVEWFSKQCKNRSKLDVCVNHGNGLYEVSDYKSGKKFGNEVKHSQQGLLYAVSTIMNFPDCTDVVVKFIYVDQDDITIRTFNRAALVRMLPSWNNRFAALRNEREWLPKPSKIHCRFCPWAPKVNGGDGYCESGVEVPRP